MSAPQQIEEEEPTPSQIEYSKNKQRLIETCQKMCADISHEKPEDVASFMISWLQNNFSYSSSGLSFEEKKELHQLRNEVEIFRDLDEHNFYIETNKPLKKDPKEKEKKSKGPPKPKPRLPLEENLLSDDEDYNNFDDDVDEQLDDIKFIENKINNRPRKAVCENVKGKFNEETENKMKGVKKSPELIEFMKINMIKSPLFSELTSNELKMCIDCMEEKTYTPVVEVFKQGTNEEFFYFVVEGNLECKIQFTTITVENKKKKVEKSEPKLIKTYKPGDFFGELSLLYNLPRRGTVRTVDDVKLYVLDRQTYKKIIMDSYKEKTLKRLEKLKTLKIFSTLDPNELEKVEQIEKEGIFSKGEKLIEENDYGNVLYIIDEGKCIGTQTIEEGKIPIKVNEYTEKNTIGEGSLIKGEKSNENIIADSDIVKVSCIDRHSFKANLGSIEPILMRDLNLYNEYFPALPDLEKIEEEKQKQDDSKDKKEEQQPPVVKKEEILTEEEKDKKLKELEDKNKQLELEKEQLKKELAKSRSGNLKSLNPQEQNEEGNVLPSGSIVNELKDGKPMLFEEIIAHK